MKTQREAPEEARKQAVDELADAATKQKAATDIKDHIEKLSNKLDPKRGAYRARRSRPRRTRRPTICSTRATSRPRRTRIFLTKIREVEQLNLDHASARRRLVQIVTASAYLTAGALGAGAVVGGVISHRITAH